MHGQPPHVHRPYVIGDSKLEVIDRSLEQREAALKLIKFYLQRAQNRMKVQTDKNRVHRLFQVGDFVYLKLQPCRQSSVVNRTNMKLTTKYFFPFELINGTNWEMFLTN